MHRRELTAEETAAIAPVLAALERNPVDAAQLQRLLDFVQGDHTGCSRLAKKTSVVQRLAAVVSTPVTAETIHAVGLGLRVLEVLAVESQSAAVTGRFAAAEQCRTFLPLFHHALLLPPLSGFLFHMFHCVDGAAARAVAWDVGVPHAVVQQLPLHAGDERAVECLAMVLTALCGWHSERHDDASFAVPVLCSSIQAAFAQQHSAALAALMQCVTSTVVLSEHGIAAVAPATAMLGQVTAGVLSDPNAPVGLSSAALTMLYTFCDLDRAFDERLRSGIAGNLGFLWTDELLPLRSFVTQLRRNAHVIRMASLDADTVTAALTELDAAVCQAPPHLLELFRHAIAGAAFHTIRTLLLPLASVEEQHAVEAAKLLAFALRDNPTAAHAFVTFGGVSVLRDVVDDYAEAVLSAAAALFGALMTSRLATREIIDVGLWARLVDAFANEVVEPVAAGTAEVGAFGTACLHLFAGAKGYAGLDTAPPSSFDRLIGALARLLVGDARTRLGSLVPLACAAVGAVLSSTLNREAASVATLSAQLTTTATELLTEGLNALQSVDAAAAQTHLLNVAAASSLLIGCVKHDASGHAKACVAESAACLAAIDTTLRQVALMAAHTSLWALLAAVTSGSFPAQKAIASHAGVVAVAIDTITAADGRLSQAGDDQAVAVSELATHCVETHSHLVATSHLSEADATRTCSAIARLLAHANATTELRHACVDALQANVPILRRSADVTTAPCLWVLLLCENSDEEPMTMLANRCFKLMLMLHDTTLRTLLHLTDTALTLFTQPGAAAPLNPWPFAPLEPMHDADDAHDMLVAVLPLLNGLIHHDPKCCDAVFASGATGWTVFLRVLEATPAELGLKAVAIFAIANLLNHCRNADHALPLLERAAAVSRAAASFLVVGNAFAPGAIRAELPPATPEELTASEAGVPTEETLAGAVDTLFFMLDRLVVLARMAKLPHATLPVAGDARSQVLLRVATGNAATVAAACSLLMCWLQEPQEFTDGVAALADGGSGALPAAPFVAGVKVTLQQLAATHTSNDVRVQAAAALRLELLA